ncbi:MAG: sugar ABC transporter substrate-binding protein [Chloroflexota bacterium]
MALNRVVRMAGILVASAAIVVGCTSSSASTAPSAAASAAPSAAASAAPSAAPSAAGKIKLGVAFPNSDTFLSRVQDGMKKEAEAKGVDITITDAKDDTAAQQSQVENFISQGVSAIIVVPVDTSAAQPMADAAKKANIPLVFVNRNPSIAGVPYVGSDSLYAGTVEMEALAKLVGGKGDVVILEGQVTNEAAVLRTKGCNDVVAKNPGMKVVATLEGAWDRAKGQSITENWIQSGTLKAGMVVCANNDEMALGAINAIKAAKIDLKPGTGIVVGGVDATSEALAAMQAGDLAVTVFQDAKGQGKGGVDAAIDLINGTKVEDFVNIPYQLVTPENIKDFLGAN